MMSHLYAKYFQASGIFYLCLVCLLTSGLRFMFLPLPLLVTNWYLFILIFLRYFFPFRGDNNSTQNMLPNIKLVWRNKFNIFWTWNNCTLTKYHTGDSAEWIRIIWAKFGSQVLGTPRRKCEVIPLQARCDPEGGWMYSSTLPWPRY